MPVARAEEHVFVTWAPGRLGVAADACPAGDGAEMPAEESAEERWDIDGADRSAVLNIGGAAVYSVSCASAGNCSAGGDYVDGSGNIQAFVVSQVNGIWGTAEEVPGTAALNAGGGAAVNSVSCPAGGGLQRRWILLG
jgi:hypothetical protein